MEGRYPLDISDTITTIANNISKTAGSHTLKAGIYADRFTRNTNIAVNFQGNFSFARTVRPGLAPSEQVVAVALRNTLPEFLATAAKTSILVKFIRDRLDLSRTEGISLAA